MYMYYDFRRDGACYDHVRVRRIKHVNPKKGGGEREDKSTMYNTERAE